MSKAARYVISKDSVYNSDNTFSNFYCNSLRSVVDELILRKYFVGTLFIIDLKKDRVKGIYMVNGNIITESGWYNNN